MNNLLEISQIETNITLTDIKKYLKIRIILLIIQIAVFILLVIGIFDFSASVDSMTKSIEHNTFHSYNDCCYQLYN